MLRLVIDTDPGIDDALAIIMACTHEQTTVEALTVVAGNVDVDVATDNALRVLELLKLEHVPVYAGADRAILGNRLRATSHGRDGLGDSDLPASPRLVSVGHASLRLIDLANRFPGELALVALGPLTNLAVASCIDPDLPKKFRQLIVMGGAIRSSGNMNDGSCEFNFAVDPEAVSIVFDRWERLTLVPWETTLELMLSMNKVNDLIEADSEIARFVSRIGRHRADLAFAEVGIKGWFVPDPVAMVVALDPSTVVEADWYAVSVDLHVPSARGRITVDWRHTTGRKKSVEVVTKVDPDKFWHIFRQAICSS